MSWEGSAPGWGGVGGGSYIQTYDFDCAIPGA